MSIIRNRELSQFGSFIYIDNDSQKIGITTGATPFVGIGTANPTVKFHVVGDTNLDGNVNIANGTLDASSYTLNGNPLVDVTVLQWNYASNGTDMYRLQGNIGIGTSVFTQRLTVLGNISAGQFISTVTSGTAPLVVLSDTQVTNLNASFLRGKVPPSGTIVGNTDIQTLTNKTLTSVTVSPSGLIFTGPISGTTTLQASAVASGVLTLPGATTTLVGRTTTDTLTNKTLAAGSNTITGLTNTNLSGTAGITNANLANPTISGIALGGSLNALSFGSGIIASGSYNGSTAVTISAVAVGGTWTNVGNELVRRDISGDFTAGTITATDFNSTSDLNLKENIKTVENSLNTLTQLRGVSFDWKETGKGSYGVIAQELEEVLPQLVKDGEIKSVNYNGLIGVLIEAVKELKKEIEELKKN